MQNANINNTAPIEGGLREEKLGTKIFWLLIAITLLTDPVTSLHFLFDYSAVLDYLLMLFLLFKVYSYKKKHSTNIAKFALFILLVYIIKPVIFLGPSEVLGKDMPSYIKAIFALLFFYIAYSLFQEKKIVISFKVWEQFLFWICCCTIITFVLYKIGGGMLFLKREVLGYPTAQIPFVGLIHYDDNMKLRPSWFFDEPSYLGDILGFNLMMVCKYYLQRKSYKKIVIYLLAIIVTGSMTGIGCAFAAFPVSFVMMKISRKKTIPPIGKLLLLFLIPTFITAYSAFDSSSSSKSEVIFSESSLSTRQSRLIYGLNELTSASTANILYGKGHSYNDSDMGVANAYLDLLLGDGIIILVFFIILVFVLLKHADYEYCYMLLSLNMIDLTFLPFIMLMLIIAKFYYKDKVAFSISNQKV